MATGEGEAAGTRTSAWARVPGGRAGLVVLIIIAMLVLLRILLSPLVVWYANKRLHEIPGYTGHLRDVRLHLIGGWYTIDGLELYAVEGKKAEPVFEAPAITVRVLWGPLFHKQIVGDAHISHPKIIIYQAMLKKKPPIKPVPPPYVAFRRLLPVEVDRFVMRDAEIHFKDDQDEPGYDLYAKKVDLQLRNLANRHRRGESNFASMEMSGVVMDSGQIHGHASINPLATPPDFYISFKMTGLELTKINDLARTLAKLDFEKGTFDMASEISAENGFLHGYAKPVFKDLQVFSWKKDVKGKREGIARELWEGAVGAAGEIFRNQPENQIATRIPISGRLDDPKISVAEAIGTALRNAFGHALLPTIEHSVGRPSH